MNKLELFAIIARGCTCRRHASSIRIGRAANETETAAAAGRHPHGLVPFRMEQQWLIQLKLALAEQPGTATADLFRRAA